MPAGFLNKKITALIAASQNGHVKTVEALLRGGADPNLTDQVGLTALMYASMYGHVEVMQLLIEAGSPVNQKDEQSKQNLSQQKTLTERVSRSSLFVPMWSSW